MLAVNLAASLGAVGMLFHLSGTNVRPMLSGFAKTFFLGLHYLITALSRFPGHWAGLPFQHVSVVLILIKERFFGIIALVGLFKMTGTSLPSNCRKYSFQVSFNL